ncbi:MAG: glycine cleavage system protein GcvH [Planctomycetota bacterium]|jgi:glycine cleavage system H protein
MVPEELKYSKDHEWIKIEGGEATIGITDHAQSQLGDITYVELPEEDEDLSAGDSFGTVESVKAASDCFMPLSGKVSEINEELENTPEVVNSDPYGDGWLIKVEIADESEIADLMDAKGYEELLKEEEE